MVTDTTHAVMATDANTTGNLPHATSQRSSRRAPDRAHTRRQAGSDAGTTGQTDGYPHLRLAVADLPDAPGVYLFQGQPGDLPLYIGKSIHLRSRVLAHLRAPDEARMLQQTRRIEHIRTAGELGALLLESALIKQQQPLYNRKLRRNRQLCAWQVVPGSPLRLQLAAAQTVNFATTPQLYGLFASRHAATEALQALADRHGLCLSVLGLEKGVPGKACFRHMVKRCAGACCGHTSQAAHDARTLAALADMQLVCWPFAGAVALQEVCPLDPQFVQYHVVRNWCYLGSAPNLAQARQLDTVAAGFDADGYKIVCKPILQQQTPIIEL